LASYEDKPTTPLRDSIVLCSYDSADGVITQPVQRFYEFPKRTIFLAQLLYPWYVLDKDVVWDESINEPKETEEEGCPVVILASTSILLCERLTGSTPREQERMSSAILYKASQLSRLDVFDMPSFRGDASKLGILPKCGSGVVMLIQGEHHVQPSCIKA